MCLFYHELWLKMQRAWFIVITDWNGFCRLVSCFPGDPCALCSSADSLYHSGTCIAKPLGSRVKWRLHNAAVRQMQRQSHALLCSTRHHSIDGLYLQKWPILKDVSCTLISGSTGISLHDLCLKTLTLTLTLIYFILTFYAVPQFSFCLK